jgi:hypothetical protein
MFTGVAGLFQAKSVKGWRVLVRVRQKNRREKKWRVEVEF